MPRTNVSEVEQKVHELFETHGAEEILRALAQRVREEAGIAHGESRPRDARNWQSFADDIEAAADNYPEHTGD